MKMNNGSKLGLIIASLGGIIAIAGLAVTCEITVEGITSIALLLLISVMFFALAGAFTKNGQWAPAALTLFGFLTLGVVAGCTIAEIINLYLGIIEAVVAILVIAISYTPQTKRFVSSE
ncbi:MAG: hypothetical protein MJZ21_01350 [archaeon]|nr:hypothetical protein [archaeon]